MLLVPVTGSSKSVTCAGGVVALRACFSGGRQPAVPRPVKVVVSVLDPAAQAGVFEITARTDTV